MTPQRLPYPGLRAFTREESDLFFGRDGCVDAMVDRLAATRFLAVLGASGSGKSSLVRTGLLDALDLGLHPWAGSRWRIADMHPGGQPIRNLACALLGSGVELAAAAADIDALAIFLRRGPRSVGEWVSGGNLEPGTNLLILVDQFEELFRYGSYARQEEAEAFVALLLETASTPGVKIHVVVTMRSEFLGACALIPGLAEKINAGLYLTPRMTREECREAIEGPAGVSGFQVEGPLVNRLLNDLASFAPWDPGDAIDQAERLARRADQLPLMQHVLNRLWARAREEASSGALILRLADYDGLGGLSGALDAHGGEVLAALGPERAPAVQTVFRSLVTGPSVALAVRRPSTLGELVLIAGSREDVVAIVEAFRAPDCNFLRTSEDALTHSGVIVDISHESLIRQWTLLREWLENEARASAAWARLAAAEERYTRGEGGLLKGLDLAGLVAWWETAAPISAWAERYGGKFEAVQTFVENSRQAEAAQADAEKQRQKRERTRLWTGIAGLATALILAITFGVQSYFRHLESQAVNGRLEASNAQLKQQIEKTNQAEKRVLLQLDVANRAQKEAESAQRVAQAMLQKANESAKTVSDVKKTLLESKDLAEARLKVDDITKDRGSAQASNLPHALGMKSQDDAESLKHLDTARQDYAHQPTADNLSLLWTAASQRFDTLTKLKRNAEAKALLATLAADTEKLLVKSPGLRTSQVAWDVLMDEGDHLKDTDPAAARKLFMRGLAIALSLPADELYRRLVSYERIGDRDVADGKFQPASEWYEKEVAAARKRFTLEETPDHLTNLRIATTKLYDAMVKLNRQSDANEMQKPLLADTEALLKKAPGAPAYQVAWDILTDQGDRIRATDAPAARRLFVRSLDMANLLPDNTASDLYKRMFSYERLGDLDVAESKLDSASDWYGKELAAARKSHEVDPVTKTLDWLRIASNKLYGVEVKRERLPEADAIQKALVETAERHLKKSTDTAGYQVAWDILTDQGDRLKANDGTAARAAFARSVEVAELLPNDNSPDIYRRMFSYERVGDRDLADNKLESAREWYSKEVAAARKSFGMQPTAKSLESLTTATNRLYGLQVKLSLQSEAEVLERQLVDDAEMLIKKKPETAVYQVVWDILTDQGDRLKGNRPAARKAFLRSVQVAELLPSDNAADLYRRIFSYERLGDSFTEDHISEAAGEWYSKELATSKKRFGLEATAATIKSLRTASFKLYDVEVQRNRRAEAEALRNTMIENAEGLEARGQSDDVLRECIAVYAAAVDRSDGVDPVLIRRYLVRTEELVQKLSSNTPDTAFGRYQAFVAVTKAVMANGTQSEARTAYLDLSRALEKYLTFRSGPKPQQASADTSDLAATYGNLSFDQLLAGEFTKAAVSARHGLALQPDLAWVEANLAHALLLSGNEAEAREHYMKVRKAVFGDRSIVAATAEDFGILKKLGFTHSAMDDVLKQMEQ